MELLDKETRADLETKYGKILAFDCGSGRVFAFRAPAKADMDRYESRTNREDDEAFERLLRECVVYPGPAEFAAFIEEKPFAPVGIWTTYRAALGGKVSEADAPDGAPGVKFFEAADGQIFGLKTPTRDVAKRFGAESKGNKFEAVRNLVLGCVTHAAPKSLSEFATDNPFIFGALGDECVILGGFRAEHLGK